MIVEVLGKQYEVIEILQKKYPEHDLFLCKSKYGFKECFQRFDIGREARSYTAGEQVSWACDEIRLIKSYLEKGKTIKEITEHEELKRHTPLAIETKARRIKQQIIFEEKLKATKPRFNFKF
jgi:hypothetical protein